MKLLLLSVGAVLIIGLVIWVGSSLTGADTSALDAADPTDEQIRQIADLLVTEDTTLFMRAREKLLNLSERSLPALQEFALTETTAAFASLDVIVQIKPEAACALAEPLYEQADAGLRSAALKALASCPPEQKTIELRVRAVGDSDAAIRMEAAILLGATPRTNRSMAVAALRKLKADPELDVREIAAESLFTLTGRDHSAEFNLQ